MTRAGGKKRGRRNAKVRNVAFFGLDNWRKPARSFYCLFLLLLIAEIVVKLGNFAVSFETSAA